MIEAYIPELISPEDLMSMKKYGGGYRVGFGEKIAVLVIDMTEAFVDDRYSSGYSKTGKPAMMAIKKLLDKIRTLQIPIFYTKGFYSYKETERGRWLDKIKSPIKPSESNEIAVEIAPKDEDIVIMKGKPSAFFGTQLLSMLIYHHIDTLIVTGMVTSGCVRATVIDAFSYNYKVIIPKECVADRSQISHKISLFDMDNKYADVTTLLKTLEYLDSAYHKH